MQVFVKLSILVLVLLGIATVAAFAMGGFAPLIGIASGFLFLYYLALFLGAKYRGESTNKLLIYGFYILFLAPIVVLFIDAEALFEFLLQGVQFDMK